MISLAPMTRELFHEYYRGFRYDPAVFNDMELYEKCRSRPYDEAEVNRHYDARMSRAGSLSLAAMLDGRVIGDVVLKKIDREKKQCEIGIHLISDEFKGLGYGTEALRQAISYAFDKLGINRVLADCIVKNTRSRHVIEKLGFCFLGEEDGFYKFELCR